MIILWKMHLLCQQMSSAFGLMRLMTLMDSILQCLQLTNLLVFFKFSIILLLRSFLSLVKITQINSPSYGVLQTITSFLSNFVIFIEIISFSLLDKGYVGLIFQVGNSFKYNLRPLVIIPKIYLSLVYSYQFLLKHLRLSPAKFITSLSSSVSILS